MTIETSPNVGTVPPVTIRLRTNIAVAGVSNIATSGGRPAPASLNAVEAPDTPCIEPVCCGNVTSGADAQVVPSTLDWITASRVAAVVPAETVPASRSTASNARGPPLVAVAEAEAPNTLTVVPVEVAAVEMLVAGVVAEPVSQRLLSVANLVLAFCRGRVSNHQRLDVVGDLLEDQVLELVVGAQVLR